MKTYQVKQNINHMYEQEKLELTYHRRDLKIPF